MQQKYIKDKNQTVTKKIVIIPLLSLIPTNFSKKSLSVDLLSINGW
jgi:hypothetical protein